VDYVVSNVDKVPADDELQVRLCNYTDVYNNEFITLDLDFMQATATEAEIAKFGIAVYDVIITKDSESWDDIGVPALVKETAPDLVCGYHLALLRPRKQHIIGPFLFRCLQAKPVGVQLELATNGVTRFGIPKSEIGALALPVPPLLQQRSIADYLDRETARIDALITAKERQLRLLPEKRRTLITRAVTRGLDSGVPFRDSGIPWLGEIPAHWEVKRLKYVGHSIIGLTYNPADTVNNGQGLLVLRASNVRDQRIVFDDNVYVLMDVPTDLITRVGDILICSRSGSRALIGKSAQIDETSAGLTFGAFMTLFRSPYNDYLFFVLNSPLFDYQAGAFSTSTINQLTIETLKSFEVPIPPPEEQKTIVENLRFESRKIDQVIDLTLKTVALLKERRAALIAAAVTGQIDVGDGQ
jgi:type I restriction enzyme S subunit